MDTTMENGSRFQELTPEADLETVLAAWHTATVRLERTHEALREEVRRLTHELEAKNRELARQERLAHLGQMASHVAHEVRNNLVPVSLYLSLLRRRLGGDVGSLEVLDKVDAGLMALDTTVNDLLHFTAEREPRLARFPLCALVEDVRACMQPQLTAQSIRATVNVAEQLEVVADRDMLRRAVLNLVLNAVDVMPHGGELVVTACAGCGAVELEVSDSGPGLNPAVLGRLFEPFFTTKNHGTGLGLAIVERVATAHGGSVLAQNCPEGGAAFTLRLPDRAEPHHLEKAA